jgi:hypothetical protein
MLIKTKTVNELIRINTTKLRNRLHRIEVGPPIPNIDFMPSMDSGLIYMKLNDATCLVGRRTSNIEHRTSNIE